MAQYKQSDITHIFWASNEGFKAGRDPLGIENSSVATYSTLLPGLTNLTGHIRYYSLYCWLLMPSIRSIINELSHLLQMSEPEQIIEELVPLSQRYDYIFRSIHVERFFKDLRNQ